jgi:hypothetical protein
LQGTTQGVTTITRKTSLSLLTRCASGLSLSGAGHPSRVEQGTPLSPIRQELVHNSAESFIVTGFQQVRELMDDDVFEALRADCHQLEIQPDPPRFRVAGSPACSHPADSPRDRLDPHARSPGRNQVRKQGIELFTVPLLDRGLPLVSPRARVHAKLEDVIAPKLHLRRSGVVSDDQSMIHAPETVRLPRDIFGDAGWSLQRQSCPRSLYPLDSCDNCAFDVTRGRATRRRDPHVAAPMYADRQVSNAFVGHRRVDAGRVNAVLPQREESFCEVHRSTQ